jgi:hypothetical protein
LRVRDELRLTIESYQTLYHNSISYGRKKAVQAEAGIADLETDIQKLEYQREELEAKKNQLTHDSLVCVSLHADYAHDTQIKLSRDFALNYA